MMLGQGNLGGRAERDLQRQVVAELGRRHWRPPFPIPLYTFFLSHLIPQSQPILAHRGPIMRAAR